MRVPLVLFSLFLAIAESSAQTSQIELISKGPATLDFGGNADSGAPALSADGRFILFSSAAENLVFGVVKQPVTDIYLHDRQSNVTRLISLSTNATTGADNHCWNPQISPDGTRVMFETAAANLVSTLTNGTSGVLVYDLEAGSVAHASVGRNGTNASAPARNALLSADGRTVVFESAAINLTTGIVYRTPETPHIFARHVESNKTELIDTNYRNQEPARSGVTSFSSIVGINSNGTRVAFLSNGTNFIQVFPSSYRSNNLWVRDLILGTNILVSSFSNQPSSFDIRSPSMSADGTKFLYSNGRTNFFRDIAEPNAVTTRIPTNVVALTISPDGELAAYFRWVGSEGGTIEPITWGPKIFVGRVMDDQFVEVPVPSSNGEFLFSADSQTIVVSTFEEVFDQVVSVGDREVRIKSANTFVTPAVSADASVVATEWRSSTDAILNVFVEETNTTTLISKAIEPNEAPLPPTQAPEDVSSDGGFVLFTSFAALVPEDQNDSQDVYLWDRVARTNLLVSRAPTGAVGNAGSFMPRMTPDGEHVVFVSAATNLVSNDDTNRSYDVFIWTRSNNTVRSVTPRAEGLSPTTAPFPTTLACSWPVLSKDGRYIAFVSRRQDLVAGTLQPAERIYLRDLENNVTVRAFPTNVSGLAWARTVAVQDGPLVFYLDRTNLVSFDVATATAKGYSNCVNEPSFSSDGARMAVISKIGSVSSLFVWDIASGERREMYRYPAGVVLGLESSISLSGDGKRVAFVTGDPLAVEDVNGTNDVYVAEVDQPGVFRWVRADSARMALAVRSAYPSLNENGRRVSFLSKGNQISPRLIPSESRVYLVDLPLRRSEPVSSTQPRNPYFGIGYNAPLMLPNGSGVVLGATEGLHEFDFNRAPDTYFAGFSFPPMLDTDGDELPDDWEITVFGNLGEGAEGDADEDGQSNLSEYHAGTNAASADSLLEIEIAEAGVNVWELTWYVIPGKSYELQFKPDLNQPWQPLTGQYSVENGVARFLTTPVEQTGFYRIHLKE